MTWTEERIYKFASWLEEAEEESDYELELGLALAQNLTESNPQSCAKIEKGKDR